VNVARHVGVNLVLQHQSLPRIPHVLLISGDVGGVHRSVRHSEDPRGLGAVNGSEVVLHPLVLLVVLVDLTTLSSSSVRSRVGQPKRKERMIR